MQTRVFRMKGTFRMGTQKRQPFTKEIVAPTLEAAKHVLFSELGSKHRCKRADIKIEQVEEVKKEEYEGLTDPKALYFVRRSYGRKKHQGV